MALSEELLESELFGHEKGAFTAGPWITPDDLPGAVRDPGPAAAWEQPRSFHAAVEEFKRGLIESTLRKTNGNRTRAAARLGLQRTYLARLIRDLGLRQTPPPVGHPTRPERLGLRAHGLVSPGRRR